VSSTGPICSDVVQYQPSELGRGLIGREVFSGLDDLVQLHVDVLDFVRRTYDSTHFGWTWEEWDYLFPLTLPHGYGGGEFAVLLIVRNGIERRLGHGSLVVGSTSAAST
jgi:hypothetical protein